LAITQPLQFNKITPRRGGAELKIKYVILIIISYAHTHTLILQCSTKYKESIYLYLRQRKMNCCGMKIASHVSAFRDGDLKLAKLAKCNFNINFKN
jgi:hypothetical protein